jgi:hypothetical protein
MFPLAMAIFPSDETAPTIADEELSGPNTLGGIPAHRPRKIGRKCP